MPDSLERQARSAFSNSLAGAAPTALGHGPGRVELLGNHTDYNGGLVMSAAIDRGTVVVGRPSSDRQARVISASFVDTETFPIDEIPSGEPGQWGRYVRGVVWSLQERYGPLASGFEAALAGDVPLGAGLSSSASLEAALGMFLIAAGLLPGVGVGQNAAGLDDAGRMELAHALRRAENEFVGVASGLLDQFSSLFGHADGALFLDCRTLEHARVGLGTPAPTLIICDSKTSRQLADGMYNRRRDECERVVTYFQQVRGADAVQQLRDLTLEELSAHWDRLDPVGRRRARHVLTENQRVRQGLAALRSGETATFGRVMSASHASSRDDFENSSPALDALIEAAEAAPGFLGGKLSGAGWAGCTINLVAADRAADFGRAVRSAYAQRMGVEPEIHICRAAEGASGRTLG